MAAAGCLFAERENGLNGTTQVLGPVKGDPKTTFFDDSLNRLSQCLDVFLFLFGRVQDWKVQALGGLLKPVRGVFLGRDHGRWGIAWPKSRFLRLQQDALEAASS